MEILGSKLTLHLKFVKFIISVDYQNNVLVLKLICITMVL